MTPNTYGLKSLFILLATFIVTMTLAFLSGCLCAAILVYFKNGSFIFGWHEDVLFSIKRGIVVGIPTAVGIWLLSKMKDKGLPRNSQ
ncbi:immunity protein [Erwinia endophytica]|uniref:immunity protein n=1 Tax=Erwinia endophytica TaxID=1563158 RepID=UPI001265F228|nr:immunity protein [Erwinia endophytica]KAB8310064.1 immunity protein [Erwinia endophytica]